VSAPDVGHPCGSCPLNGRVKVRGEGPDRPRSKRRGKGDLAFLGEAPGAQEVRQGKPFVGPSGSLLQLLLRQASIDRRACIVTNAMLCPIPDKDDLGKSVISEAISCCNRRRQIEGDLKNADFIIGLGGYAGQALTGHSGVQDVRGCIQQSAWGPCLVTYHPSYLLKGRKDQSTRIQADVFAQVVVADFLTAIAYRKGGRGPTVKTRIGPSPEELEVAVSYIINRTKLYALDVEADGLDMLSAGLNVVGISYQFGDFIRSLVIPWWEGNYTPEDAERIRRLLLRLFRSADVTMIAHNAQYDATLIERNFCSILGPIRDTLITHKACWPEIRHDLQNVVSQFYIVEPWKYRFWTAEGARKKLLHEAEKFERRYRRTPNDKTKATWAKARAAYDRAWQDEARQLCEYNGFDVGYTLAIWPKLVDAAKQAKVMRVAITDSRLGEITRRMTIDGIPLLVGEQGDLSRTLEKQVRLAKRKIDGLIRTIPESDDGDAKRARSELLRMKPGEFNPKSGDHASLLLDAYEVPCDMLTKTGKRSTSKEALGGYLDSPVVVALTEFKDADSILRTIVKGEGMTVAADGRLHPSWNAHGSATKDPEKYGTVSGRWASSPNMQNWQLGVRKLVGFSKDDPRVLVSADYSQIELRILALVSGEEKLIEVLNDPKRDPHAENAAALFDDDFTSLEPKSPEWTELRKLTKTSLYAWMYGAGVGTMFVQVRKDVPGVTMRQIEYLRECFNEMCPSILDYREELLRQTRQRGELRTLFLGRRRLFPLAGVVEPDASVIWNFPIQGTAADIISLRVLKLYPYLPDGTVLISQIHDAILLEAMADNSQAVASIVAKYLPYKVVYGGRTMPFPVEVKIGKTWADV